MRLGIISDIHENVEMLTRALILADFHKCDELVCLGDIVGFDERFYRNSSRRSAKLCIKLIKDNCRWVVPGNHDLFAAGRVPEYTNGFDFSPEWFTMDGIGRKKASKGKVWSYDEDAHNDLGEDEILFLKELPEYLITKDPGVTCLFSHYIYPDLTGSTTRYVERNHQLRDLWEFMEEHDVRYSFSGHSHRVFAGFAYKGSLNGAVRYLKAVHSIPSSDFYLGDETVMILLPPLSGEKGRTGFSIFDTDNLKLNIISTNPD